MRWTVRIQGRATGKWGIVGLVAAGLGLACGGDSEEGGGKASERLASLPVSQLSAEDTDALCQELQQDTIEALDYDRLNELFCEAFSAAASPDPATCVDAKETCLTQSTSVISQMDVDELVGEMSLTDCTSSLSQLTCDRTVSEFTTCYNDIYGMFDQLFGAITCDDAGDSETTAGLEMQMPTEPASCEPLASECGLELGFE